MCNIDLPVDCYPIAQEIRTASLRLLPIIICQGLSKLWMLRTLKCKHRTVIERFSSTGNAKATNPPAAIISLLSMFWMW